MQQSLAGSSQTTRADAPQKSNDYETLKDLTSSLLKEHESHGVELVEGCRWCTYRAVWKIQHNAPSKRKGLEFIANIPLDKLNAIIADVSFALQDWNTVRPMVAGEMLA